MIVVDASAAAELLLRLPASDEVETAIFDEPGGAHAPSLLDAEVLHVLRRHERGGRIAPERAGEAVADLIDLPITRYPLAPLTEQAWSLRHNLSAYDAFYGALAIGLEAALITADRALAAALSAHAGVEVTLV